ERRTSDALAFRQHLEECAECSAEMAMLRRLWDRLGDLPIPEPSQALHARWQATLADAAKSATLAAQQPASRGRTGRNWSLTGFWPRNPAWQAAIAAACLVAGILVGTHLPRQEEEIARLREEVANTREMVALSLLQQESATERLRGVDYTGRLKTMEPEVVSALTDAVAHDPSVNVRLAAIDALSRASRSPEVLQSLTRSLPRQDSPMVQASLVDYLVDAQDRSALGVLRQLAAQPNLNPVVRERTELALEKLGR
ncbi:MAG TPA: HEAT repeat domain-containing protein, partial [Bryobacteraceae bacterium]|nr:HEAT repeat domain-containing protein [Bryobacteraceae bacterium]